MSETQKYYRDSSGRYIGSFLTPDDAEGNPQKIPAVLAGAIECPRPPHGKATWNGTGWDYTPAYRPIRRDMYGAAGVKDSERLDALWVKLIEGSSTKVDALKVKRDAVRAAAEFPAIN